MTPAEIRNIVAAVLAEQQDRSRSTAEEAAAAVLRAFGLDDEDHKELRADFQHLRRWRKSVEGAQALTFKITLGTIVSGLLGAIWLGLKVILNK
ncbi:hypothetical protein ACQR1H_03260 [Bradyrhizobium sp. HKCCYLRH2015]|uniref:hypothetical protein n=1 Tax=Bradyrhizobium sp. HKCCYLRH2015 TaxID=3420742 RepID=UPI003EBB34EA